MSHPVIGIDLGTTNSCIATIEHEIPTVISSAEGGRTTPSVVGFIDSDERLVGDAAKRQAVANPEDTVFSIKRFMGRKIGEVTDEQKTVPYKIAAGPEEAVRINVAGQEFAPEQISALILTKLKRDAEAYFDQEISEAVITVPAYFNDAQRQATKDAAEIAGIKVQRLVNEPTAAALAYGIKVDDDDDRRILIVDLGGGTFDVSVLEIDNGVFEVRATRGDNHLGGDDFDKAIVDFLVTRLKDESGVDISDDASALQRFYEAAEKAKVELSSSPETVISLPYIGQNADGPVHLNMPLSRSELAAMVSPLLTRLEGPINKAIADSDITADELDSVLLVGGMTRMPAVQEIVEKITGKQPLRGVNPDEAVALGAATQAAVLSGDIEGVVLVDVTPLTLGIETHGGIATPVISANTAIPTRVTDVFTTSENNQPSVEVHIFQGDRPMAIDNRSLGRVVLLGIPPAPAGVPQIEVTFSIDSDGVLEVTAVDLDRNVRQELKVESSTRLPDELVKQMREEAERYATQDVHRRQLAEVKNELRTFANQVEKALDADHDFDGESVRAIREAVDEVNVVLKDNPADLDLFATAHHNLTVAVDEAKERSEQRAQSISEPIEVARDIASEVSGDTTDGTDTGVHGEVPDSDAEQFEIEIDDEFSSSD